MITQELLKELVTYDPETGVFRWRTSRVGCRAGDVVGSHVSNGYLGTSIKWKKIYLHRAAWLYMTGSYPKSQIDHINGDRADNRWTNLREATQHQNSGNSKKKRCNTSGYKGVFWNKKHNKWGAQIRINYKTKYLRLFATKEEAAASYAAGAKAAFGDYARFG